MKRKFDFVLYDDKRLYRDVIRFYPRSSHVHSFNNDPPTNWEDVYKVYYSWAIIRQYYKSNDQNSIQPRSTKKLFDMSMDECSRIPDLSVIIKDVMNTGKTFHYPTMGQPAGDWKIERTKYYDFDNKKHKIYKFEVFNNWTNQGFRFWLKKDEVSQFCDWLDMVNQYMLEHGEGI